MPSLFLFFRGVEWGKGMGVETGVRTGSGMGEFFSTLQVVGGSSKDKYQGWKGVMHLSIRT